MTIKDKRLLKLISNPKETPFNELKTVLQDFGYELKKIRGSHVIFKHQNTETIIFPVHCNKTKKRYVKNIIKTLSRIS